MISMGIITGLTAQVPFLTASTAYSTCIYELELCIIITLHRSYLKQVTIGREDSKG